METKANERLFYDPDMIGRIRDMGFNIYEL